MARTINLSNYTVGDDCFDSLPEILTRYRATRVVIVGGKRALEAASLPIHDALQGSNITVTNTIVYGHDSTQTNVDSLVNNPDFVSADVVIGVGGGKALDTVKTAAVADHHTVFTVPTICSNCSCGTAIAVLYHDDGSFDRYAPTDCPAHIFINPAIIAAAPDQYFWAGIGDGLSKEPESLFASSRAQDSHTVRLARTIASSCTEPLMTYGEEGLADVRANRSSHAVAQVALTIAINTGYVSNLMNQPDFYYNSSLAHAFYNASTGIERPGTYLHGQIVSFGVLVLFAYTGNTEELERYGRFNKKLGLPTTLAEIGLEESHLPHLLELIHHTNEWKQSAPAPFDDDALLRAIHHADDFGRTLH